MLRMYALESPSGQSQSVVAPALRRWDVAVFETVRDLQNGTLPRNGNRFLTLENGALSLGKISPKVPRSYLARVAKIRRDIIAGRIRNIPTSLTAR